MAVLSVTEFTQIGMDAERGEPQAAQVDQNTTTQNATFATTTPITNPFGVKTRLVRVVVDTNAFVTFAVTPVATTSDIFMAAGIPEYFTVSNQSNLKIAAVTA